MLRPKPYLVGVLLAVLLSCSPSGTSRDEASAGEAEGSVVALNPTLSVRVAGDTVRFVFRVANGGSAPITMEFMTAQRYDFLVMDATGAEIWRWSADQGFAQMSGEETLEPGGELEYEAEWVAGNRRGSYESIGQVVSRSHSLELRTEFELGSG